MNDREVRARRSGRYVRRTRCYILSVGCSGQ